MENRMQKNDVIELSKNRDRALKKLEDVREATQGPEAHRDVKYITGKRIELKQPENRPCNDSEK